MNFLYYLISFFVIINVIVFAHEFGHYFAARKVGVKVEKFSIGMGPELFGFSDKNGTRWCFSLLPIGGYIMMLGDGDIASTTENADSLEKLTGEEKTKSFIAKSNWEKMLIAFAGPFANYLYAFIVIVLMGCFYGMPSYAPIIGEVLKGSPAEKAGFLAGDKIISIDGKNIEKYREVLINIAASEKSKIDFVVERVGKQLPINVAPEITEKKKLFGGIKKTKLVGLKSAEPTFEKLSLLESVYRGFTDCAYATKEMFNVFSHLFAGKKSIDDFGGIVHMASIAGDLSKSGNFAVLIMFTVTLSLNLGFINLFPLPVLDGGRILICLVEQILHRKLNKKLQEYIMIVCAILLILLMLVTTLNDIMRIDMVHNYVSKILR